MRTLFVLATLVVVGAGALAAGYQPAREWWQRRHAPQWRTGEVTRGDIVAVVNSTGTIKPVLQVSVGSFVSGPIEELFVEFNQEVKKGDLLAKIDPRIYKANVDRDRATLATREAEVARVKALLQQAINDEKRAYALRAEDPAFIAQAELDKVRFNRMSLEAQLEVAQTSVEQARAQLDLSIANLNYTNITSPVDGIVIHRKIDPGQTVVAQFQTPELFVVAPDMRQKMHVHASVDEADIGLIRQAQQRGLPVTFTVDAYPDELFQGTIEEIRFSSTTTQNVVTYPVVVAAPNPELKLLPGMTASLSFEVDRRNDVVKLPNAALRFFPQAQHVRPADRHLVEGPTVDEPQESTVESQLSAQERAQARRNRRLRHVWVQDGFQLRAVAVETGLSDSHHTEMVAGELKPGDRVVIGIQLPASTW
jgi:HlyD family secretion protein